jgi:hypothetical protein
MAFQYCVAEVLSVGMSLRRLSEKRRRDARLTVIQYASATSDSLKLAGTGTGDIAEMTESLGDDEAAYAYVRMKLGNDEYSERVKFAFVVWQGLSCLLNSPPRDC